MQQRKTRKKPKKIMRIFDRVVVAMGVINLIATMPQVISVWHGKDAAGVSSLSWGYYSLFGIVLITYGIVHSQKPIIATYVGSTALYSAVFVGSLLY
jgi:uncharacterized protein with PQ loop repeat